MPEFVRDWAYRPYTRKDEDRDFARTRDFILERDYLSTHPHYGPDVPDDPMVDAVSAAGIQAMRVWGDWWDAEDFLEYLAAAGYRVVPND